MNTNSHSDILVIGSGPAGQKAAIQGAKLGRQVALIEQELNVGGACVHHGTIPSKTLREAALDMARFRRAADVFDFKLREDLEVRTLLSRMNRVVRSHADYMRCQLERNGIRRYHGRARFVSDRQVDVLAVDGAHHFLTAETIVIAAGSVPRMPEGVPVDHERILDSDSILSMIYLPTSLTVLGGGVIASEYASIFALLGVEVTLIDKGERPLAFMDAELSHQFVLAFGKIGGHYMCQQQVVNAQWDGFSKVVTTLGNGETVATDKMLVAFGRTANVAGLQVQAAGLETDSRGYLVVDEHFQTSLPRVYAVGDVIGPPGLASTAMEQGRRAVCHALGTTPGRLTDTIPSGIYTIPEMASVGSTEEEVKRSHGAALVGRARFSEVARAQVAGLEDGLLKMIADPHGRDLLGVHIVGEGATELIHVGQMGLQAGVAVDVFLDTIFNFPTLAEAYRVAALDIVNQRQAALATEEMAQTVSPPTAQFLKPFSP